MIENGELIELSRMANQAGELQPGWRTMADTAARLGHRYHWLSRHWKELGLKPKLIGRIMLFREVEIDALIARQSSKDARGGRSKKIVAVVHHGEI